MTGNEAEEKKKKMNDNETKIHHTDERPVSSRDGDVIT